MIFDMTISFKVVRGTDSDDAFETFVDCVRDELDNIDREDIMFTASIAKRTISFSVFDLDEQAPELDKIWADLRTALHASRCATPGWENGTARWQASKPVLEFA